VLKGVFNVVCFKQFHVMKEEINGICQQCLSTITNEHVQEKLIKLRNKAEIDESTDISTL